MFGTCLLLCVSLCRLFCGDPPGGKGGRKTELVVVEGVDGSINMPLKFPLLLLDKGYNSSIPGFIPGPLKIKHH
jgi:hypothetical protein